MAEKKYRVVFAIDENFVNYLIVTIQSLVENSSKDKNYIVSILCDNLSEFSREKLLNLKKDNIEIEIINVKEKLKEVVSYELNIDSHWSSATYYRILIPYLFENDSKVLYLDCDTIILDDVSKMFEDSLEENEIGAVIDYDTECYDKKRIKYIKENLNLENYKKYFNAGVILFNIEKIDKEHYIKKFMELAEKKFQFLDQDILNIIFKNKVKYLDLEWNYQYHFLFKRVKHLYNLNTKEPKIIHFTTDTKPWLMPSEILAFRWWNYARHTDIYEEIIYKNTVVDLTLSLKGSIFRTYRLAKLLSNLPIKPLQNKLKKKIKTIKPYIRIIKKFSN